MYQQKITLLPKTTFNLLDIGQSFVKANTKEGLDEIVIIYVKTEADRAIDIAGGRDVKVWDTKMDVVGISYGAARAECN